MITFAWLLVASGAELSSCKAVFSEAPITHVARTSNRSWLLKDKPARAFGSCPSLFTLPIILTNSISCTEISCFEFFSRKNKKLRLAERMLTGLHGCAPATRNLIPSRLLRLYLFSPPNERATTLLRELRSIRSARSTRATCLRNKTESSSHRRSQRRSVT